MDKKNLDELFREKFEAFREVPDKKVWAAIENSLDKKRKRRIIPLWWQLGGVAAVLAIALVTFYTLNDSVDESPTITDTEKTDSNESKRDRLDVEIKKDAIEIPEASEDAVAKGSKGTDLNNTDQYPISESEGASNSEKSSGTNNTKRRKEVLKIPEVNKDAVADSGKDGFGEPIEKHSKSKSDIDSFPTKLPNSDVAETEATLPKDKVRKDSNTRRPEKTQLATNIPDSKRGDADKNRAGENNNTKLKKENANGKDEGNDDDVEIADAVLSKKTDSSKPDFKNENQDVMESSQEKTKNSFEKSDNAVAKNEQSDTDGAKANRNKKSVSESHDDQADDTKKSIFEVLEGDSDEMRIVEEPSSRWSAGPNIAPVYFNAMGEGSPIDPGFSPNAKSGSTKMSYGVSVAYAVTKKLRVRSGIHKAEYGYDTNNVGFSPTLAASSAGRLQNIDNAGGTEVFTENSAISNSDSSANFAPEFNSLNSTRDGKVVQQFGYLEVPLELDYALIDRRFGVNLIGGLSSLFLIDNSVILSSGELTTEIGEARNLNELNFSTNIGFGVNYKFTPKVQLNIEPVFKYQLNTFSNVSGDFRPFSIGVYSGLDFKF